MYSDITLTSSVTLKIGLSQPDYAVKKETAKAIAADFLDSPRSRLKRYRYLVQWMKIEEPNQV